MIKTSKEKINNGIQAIKNDKEKIRNTIKTIRSEITLLEEKKERFDYTQLIKEPTASIYPVSPRKKLNVLIAGFLGLLIFTSIVFFLERLKETKQKT